MDQYERTHQSQTRILMNGLLHWRYIREYSSLPFKKNQFHKYQSQFHSLTSSWTWSLKFSSVMILVSRDREVLPLQEKLQLTLLRLREDRRDKPGKKEDRERRRGQAHSEWNVCREERTSNTCESCCHHSMNLKRRRNDLSSFIFSSPHWKSLSQVQVRSRLQLQSRKIKNQRGNWRDWTCPRKMHAAALRDSAEVVPREYCMRRPTWREIDLWSFPYSDRLTTLRTASITPK